MIKHISNIIAAALATASFAMAAEIENNRLWDIDITSKVAQHYDLDRREAIHLQPRLLRGRRAVSLENAIEIGMLYWDAGMTNSYYIAGTQHVDTGRIDIWMTPSNFTAATEYSFEILVGAVDNTVYGGVGTITLPAVRDGDVVGNPTVYNSIDFATAHIENPGAAPWATDFEYQQADAALNALIASNAQAIASNTALVGDGVAGIESNLTAHISNADAINAAQDDAIAAAAAGANMGGDIEGASSNAVVVAVQGTPIAETTPATGETWIMDDDGTMKPGSVDLTDIEADIAAIEFSAVSKSYVDYEISTVRGLVDGNDHVASISETFDGTNWLEIATGVWQHDAGWTAYDADIVGGSLQLNPEGYLIMADTSHVSKIELTPANDYLALFAETDAGPWYGYDATRGNIPATNIFAVKLWNGGASSVQVDQIDLSSWQYPERVGYTRDFAGLHLDVDTPSGATAREAVNVQYVGDLEATADISGSFAAGFRVDKIAEGVINNSARATGYGLIWYDSVTEHRYVDMATQFELDAALELKGDLSAQSAIADRVTAVEAGGVAISGDVTGADLQHSKVENIQGKSISIPTVAGTSPYYDGSEIAWLSILATNIVYAAGSNEIANVPPQSAAFYRAMIGTNAVMALVLDQQVVGLFSQDGLIIPYGSVNILNSNLVSNVQAYDGDATHPAYSWVGSPDMGTQRASSGGNYIERFVTGGNLVFERGINGIKMLTGKEITLADGYRAASINDIITPTEVDPLSIHPTGIYAAWTDAGGSYTSEQVIATSPLLTNGVESISYNASGTMSTVSQISADGTNWATFAETATASYVRIVATNTLPASGDVSLTISNIVAYSWSDPTRYGVTNDLRGQILRVDDPTNDRDPVNKRTHDAAIASVTPAAWSTYAATSAIEADGNPIRLGGGWTLIETQGVGVVSYADIWTGSNGLTIAVDGTPVITAQDGYQGLHIDTFASDGTNATVGVSTNGVTSEPGIQWTQSLLLPNWAPVAATSNSYPVATNGVYTITIANPAESPWFLRAVQAQGAARVDIAAPLYEQGSRVATTWTAMSVTNSWLDQGGVTNTQIYSNGLLQSWSTNGVSL